MDKINVFLKSQVAQDLEVIGRGGMVYEPTQIGEWWVMPAEMYTGTIPPEIMQKWDNFKALNIPVLGYLIADDMREVQLKREQEAEAERQREVVRQNELRLQEQQRRKEEFDKTVHEVAEVGAKVAIGVGAVAVGVVAAVAGAVMLTIGAIGALLRWDPILIAVLPDGRWVCLGAWWD